MQLHDPPMCPLLYPSSLSFRPPHRGEEESRSLVLPRGHRGLLVRYRRLRGECCSGTYPLEHGTDLFSLLQCVDTLFDVNECGGCHNFGGVSCSTIEGALATSCRDGGCVVRESHSVLISTALEQLADCPSLYRRLRWRLHPS